MAVHLPEELLILILEAIAVRTRDGPKQGWEFFEGFSRASRPFRQLALRRWFSTLAIHDEEDWEYLSTHVWILRLVRALRCSGTAWRGCCTIQYVGEPSPGYAAELKEATLQVLASVPLLEVVICDMSTPNAWDAGHIQTRLLEKFTQALPQSVVSVQLMHADFLPPAVLSKVARCLPRLRVLDLGKDTEHCPCASCTWRRGRRRLSGTLASGMYCLPSARSQHLELASQIPPLVHLQNLTFNAHLTTPSVVIAHEAHDLMMVDCPKCAEGAQETLNGERTVAMAFAEALPALVTVEWCSLFCKSGCRMFTIHRDQSGTIRLETDGRQVI